MQDDILGYTLWNEKFRDLDGIISISELHGVVVGLMSVVKPITADEWQQVISLLKLPRLNEESLQFLAEESEDIAYVLSDAELDYLPILPDDEVSLSERVIALADWCSGVVLGFGLVAQQLNEEEQEVISILQEVAGVEFEQHDDDDEGETIYQEIYELVRLIPVQLSMGRANKYSIQQSALFKNPSISTPQQHDVVEVYHPQTFS